MWLRKDRSNSAQRLRNEPGSRPSVENGHAALEKDENSENTEKPTVGFLLDGAGALLVLCTVFYTM